MSINFILRKEGITDSIEIPGSEISAYLLQKLIAEKLKMKEQDIILFNVFPGTKINPMDAIKDKSTIHVERIIKNQIKISAGIVSNEQLSEMGRKARFFMIKSSNEENIQKARQCSVWATTYSNQDKLRSAFLYQPHVFLFFATNRSYQIKGFARMQKQPAKIPQKSFWSGVSNIRLGGNFEIRWIRKQPITALQLQKMLGAQLKDRIMRLTDGQEIQSELGQKLLLIFQVPTQPYYEIKEQQPQMASDEPEKKILNLGQILGNKMMFPVPPPLPPKNSSAKSEITITFNNKQQTNQKQQKKSKSKQNQKRRESSDSQSDSSSNSSSDSSSVSSSSPSSSSRRKKKKIKKAKNGKRKQRKSRKQRRSRSKNGKRKDKKRKHSKKSKRKSRN